MNAAQDKEARERLMFSGFAAKSALGIDYASIISCSPPLPDTRCTIIGTPYFFELAEVVLQEQAQALATKGLYTTGFPDPKDKGSKAMEAVIRQKQTKTYVTHGAPVDLLLCFNKDFPMYLPDETSDHTPTDIDIAVTACKQHGAFARIWTYCSWNNDAKQRA